MLEFYAFILNIVIIILENEQKVQVIRWIFYYKNKIVIV